MVHEIIPTNNWVVGFHPLKIPQKTRRGPFFIAQYDHLGCPILDTPPTSSTIF